MNAYPGDSEDKRAARLFVYKYALAAPRAGHAFTLAGTDATEVTLMRDYLKWPAARVHFVDWARLASNRAEVLATLQKIKRDWPDVNVVHGDVNRLVPTLPQIGLAVMDFMGLMSAKKCFEVTLPRLMPGGIIGLTWHRGRERTDLRNTTFEIMEAASDVKDVKLRKHVGVERVVAQWSKSAGVTLEKLNSLDYQHKHSPMSVTVWKRKF